MVDEDSLIKAKYAVIILKVARRSPKEDVLKMIGSLASDTPHPNTDIEIANAHRAATIAFVQLATSIRISAPSAEIHWTRAAAAVSDWLDLLN